MNFLAYCTARRVQYSLGFNPHRHHRRGSQPDPGHPVDSRLRRRRAGPPRRLGRRGHRHARPDGLARRDAVDIRKERPHPGAQLRFTDLDGLRLTAFATNTRRGQLPDLELRHAAAPVAGIASAPPRPPGCATCRSNLRREPDLGRDRRARPRPDRLVPDPRPARPSRPPLGTENTAPADVSIPARIARHARRIHLRLS